MHTRDEAGFWRTFLTVLVTSALLLIVAVAVLFQFVPRLMGGTSLTVLSGSMSPTFRAGDLIAVRGVDPADVRMGDIITFQPVSGDPTLVTHRIVGIGHNTVDGLVLTTRGDANGATDRPLVADQVRGVYMYGVPFLGSVITLATPIAGPLVAVLGIALIAYAVFAFIRPHRRVAAGATVLLIALGGAMFGASPPRAVADELDVTFTGPTLNLGWTGRTYTTTETSFFGDRIVSPGDRIARSVRVVNTGPTGAALRAHITDVAVSGALEDVVNISWRADASSGGSTFGVVRAGDQMIVADLPVGQGGTLTLTLILEFPIGSTEQSQASVEQTMIAFDVLFVLEETVPVDPPGPIDVLPPTGGIIALGALVAGLVAVSAGTPLVVRAAARRRTPGGAEPRR